MRSADDGIGRGVTVIGCVQADVVMSPVTDLPSPGGTLLTEQMTMRVGGAGANAALASVEVGMEVRLIGCIGDDQRRVDARGAHSCRPRR